MGEIQEELCLESEMYSLYRVSISFILHKLIEEHSLSVQSLNDFYFAKTNSRAPILCTESR